MYPSRIVVLSLLAFALANTPCAAGSSAAGAPTAEVEPVPGLVIAFVDTEGRSLAAAQDALLADLASTAPIELLRNPHDGSLLLHVTAEGRSALAGAPAVAGVFDGVEDYPSLIPDAVRILARVDSSRRPDDAARDRLATELAKLGAVEVARTRNTNSITFDVPVRSLSRFNDVPGIASYGFDLPHTPSLAQSVPLVGITSPYFYPYGQQFVAVLDTGVRRLWPLTNRVAAEYSACFSHQGGSFTSMCPGGVTEAYGEGVAEPCSLPSCPALCEHGSNVASVIVQNSPPGIVPVNYNVRVIPIQIYSYLANGSISAFSSKIELALDYVASLKQDGVPVNVVNMSFGNSVRNTSPCTNHPYADEVALLRSLGVVAIGAAGNAFGGSSYNGVQGPACIPDVVAVGASTDTTDQVATGTSVSTCSGTMTFASFSHAMLDLWAPGDNITVLNYPAGSATRAGTSFSAPHVAGIWARLRGKYTSVTNDDILAALQSVCPQKTDPRNGVQKARVCMHPSWF
jgi:hypothetical protein